MLFNIFFLKKTSEMFLFNVEANKEKNITHEHIYSSYKMYYLNSKKIIYKINMKFHIRGKPSL